MTTLDRLLDAVEVLPNFVDHEAFVKKARELLADEKRDRTQIAVIFSAFLGESADARRYALATGMLDFIMKLTRQWACEPLIQAACVAIVRTLELEKAGEDAFAC